MLYTECGDIRQDKRAVMITRLNQIILSFNVLLRNPITLQSEGCAREDFGERKGSGAVQRSMEEDFVLHTAGRLDEKQNHCWGSHDISCSLETRLYD